MTPFSDIARVRADLAEREVQLLDNLQYGAETTPPNERLVEMGEMAPAYLLIDGWAYSFKVMHDGRRQIVRFLVPGDIANPHGLFDESSAFSVRTLTSVSIVGLGPDVWDRIAGPDQALGRKLAWILGNATTESEHVVTLGRRNAYERIAHFLVSTWDRLAVIGMVNGTHYRLPIKQEHLADYLGLSVVHVSRMLTRLREDGLARVERGTAKLDDPARLMSVGDTRPSMALRDTEAAMPTQTMNAA